MLQILLGGVMNSTAYSFLCNRCIQCPNVEEEEHDDQLTDQYLAGSSEAFDDTEAQGVENSGDTAK